MSSESRRKPGKTQISFENHRRDRDRMADQKFPLANNGQKLTNFPYSHVIIWYVTYTGQLVVFGAEFRFK